MVFHDLADFIDICLRPVIFYFEIFQLCGAFFEKSQKAFFLLLLKPFQLRNHACEHLSDLAHIFGAHVV